MMRVRTIASAALLLLTAFYVNVVLSHGEAVMEKRPLRDLSFEIGGRSGRPYLLSDEVLENLKVDDYILREYSGPSGPVWLYVGHFRSQREGQLIHSPKYCLPGSGWRPISSRRVLIDVPGLKNSPVPATVMVTQKGGEKELVVYWYRIGPTYVASEYMQKVHLVWNAIRHNRTDGSLMRLNMPLAGGDADEAFGKAEGFIREALPLISEYLPS